MPHFTDEDRKKIVKVAKALEREGCHFLVGGYGAHPNKSNGHPVKPGGVSIANYSFDPDAPVITAAQTSVGGICLGQFLDKSVGGGVLRHHRKPQLEQYLNDLASGIIGPFPGTTNLYPRHFVRDGKVVVVLGESCEGKRHFDCIGFVNFCISKALVTNWKYEYVQYRGKIAGCVEIDIKDVKNGDLVFRERVRERDDDPKCLISGKSPEKHRSPHAGICIKNNGSPAQVIMAQTRGAGVRTVPISSGCWLFARRLNYRR